jgi:hypothetical protein
LFLAALAQAGIADPGVSLPGPQRTPMIIHLAREWALDDLADRLRQAADAEYEPTFDAERGEFTWGFRLGEDHPRGQFNASMATAEIMTEGAWWRLFNNGPASRFREPTVTGIEFPDLTVTQAWWNVPTQRLLVATAPRNTRVVGRPTSFRVSNLGSKPRLGVCLDAHGRRSTAADASARRRRARGLHDDRQPPLCARDVVTVVPGRTEDAADERQHWLFVRGAGDRRLPPRVDAGSLRAHSSTRRPNVQQGDLAVCYASGWKVIFAVVEVVGHPENDPGRSRWGWRMPMRPLVVVADLADAPPVQAAGVFPRSLGRHSYIRLTKEQFEAARSAIAAVA